MSGWTALTALLIVVLRPSVRVGALLGAVSFVCLVIGYTIASEFRGLAYDPLFWSAVGIVGGPFIGAAAAGCVSPERRRAAIGSGLIAGVLAGDGVYGLTVVRETTSPVYWTLVLVLAAVLLAVVARGLGSWKLVGLQIGTAVALVAAVSAFFALLNANVG